MATTTHRAWRLRTRPVGALKDSDLELCTEAKPAPSDGQLLVKNLWVSIDPTHRIWMSDRPQVRHEAQGGGSAIRSPRRRRKVLLLCAPHCRATSPDLDAWPASAQLML